MRQPALALIVLCAVLACRCGARPAIQFRDLQSAKSTSTRGSTLLPLHSRTTLLGLQRGSVEYLTKAVSQTKSRASHLFPKARVSTAHLTSATSAAGVAFPPVIGGIETLGGYYLQVNLGGQQGLYLIDTGSPTMWTTASVGTPQMCYSDGCEIYRSWANNSLQRPPPCHQNQYCPFAITYGDGSAVQGIISTGLLTIPNIAAGGQALQANITFSAWTVGPSATQYQLSVPKLSGLMGFMPRRKDAVMQQLSAQGVVENVFSLCLDGKGIQSSIMLGRGPTPANLSTVPFSFSTKGGSQYYYMLDGFGLSVGGVNVSFSGSLRFNSTFKNGFPQGIILDTGSTLSFLPQDLLSGIVAQISAQTGAPFQYNSAMGIYCMTSWSPITNLTSFPVLNINLGPDVPPFQVLPATYMYLASGGYESPSGVYAEEYFACIGALPSSATILGDSFLDDNYLVFDNSNNVLQWTPADCSGGATLPPPPPPPTPPPPKPPKPSPRPPPRRPPPRSPPPKKPPPPKKSS